MTPKILAGIGPTKKKKKKGSAHGWKRRAIASEAEVDRLRTALVRTGRAVGAFLSDSVSTDFLMHVPDEAEAKIKTLRNVVRLMTAVIADHGEPDDDCGLTNAQLDAWQQQARAALGDDAAAPRVPGVRP